MQLRSKLLFCLSPMLMSGCTERMPEPPPRPAYVPEDADWIGGLDGGNWHHCKIRTDGLVECTLWQFETVYTTQTFKLCANQNPSKWTGFLSGRGDQRITTQDNAFELVPVGPMTIYSNGQIDKNETERARSSFAESLTARDYGKLDISCPVQLVPRS